MRISTISLAVALVLTAGCSGSSEEIISTAVGNEEQATSDTGSQDTLSTTIKAMYSGATFVSTDISAPGVVRFTNDEVFWTQSDTTAFGTYSNNGETDLTATFSSGDIPFSAAGGNIIWNSVDYVRTAKSQFDSQESLAAFVDGATYRSLNLLQGGETEDGTVGVNNWSMWFEGDEANWATHDTTAIGSYSYVDGSTFDVSFGNSVLRVAMLENDQMVVSGSVYEKDFSNQFDSQVSLIEFLGGTSYESVILRQMGPVVDGVASLGRWRIDFSNDTFQWFYEDVAEAGTVVYVDNSNFTAVFNDRESTIEVDGDDIIWDDARYSRVAE